jgi:chromosomal replication initiator protein
VPQELPPSFDDLVVDAGNRVAAAAARRVAESPGRSYNPLVISGPAGTGKSHLLAAIAERARALDPELPLLLQPLDELVDRLTAALAEGRLEAFRAAYAGLGLLLLDDLQQAAGKARTQEELARLLEELVRRGAQLVVAADRLPHEIPAFDERLGAGLASGLVVDVAPPEPASRHEIARRFAALRQEELPPPVLERLAALPLRSAHELRGAVNRLLAEREATGRELGPDDVARLLPVDEPPPTDDSDEFGAFLSDISTAVAAVVETAPWRRRIAREILRWEGEGMRTRRLELALDADSAPDVDALLDGFARDVARLRQIRQELRGAHADAAVLADPDRLPEAEALLPERAPAARVAPVLRSARPAGSVDAWYRDAEKMAWDWLALDERIMEEQG